MDAVPRNEWIIELPADDSRYISLLGEVTAHELIQAVAHDVEVQLLERSIRPRLKRANRHTAYRRFEAELRLSKPTFDLLMNGRMGYRAQYYLCLEKGIRFNRGVVDGLIPLMEIAWKEAANQEWPLAHRSLAEVGAKIWPTLDEDAFQGQPPLKPPMWVKNCENTKACKLGLHLASTSPPSIDLKGAWVSEQQENCWIPTDKKCRDELLRCFGFT